MDIIKGAYGVGKGLIKLASGTVITSPIWETVRNMYFNKKNPKKEIAKAVDLSFKDIGDIVKMTGLSDQEYEGFAEELGMKKNTGGMAYARKKNMGLKMKKGGSVKSKRKSRGTGAAKRGTKFKGTF